MSVVQATAQLKGKLHPITMAKLSIAVRVMHGFLRRFENVMPKLRTRDFVRLSSKLQRHPVFLDSADYRTFLDPVAFSVLAIVDDDETIAVDSSGIGVDVDLRLRQSCV